MKYYTQKHTGYSMDSTAWNVSAGSLSSVGKQQVTLCISVLKRSNPKTDVGSGCSVSRLCLPFCFGLFLPVRPCSLSPSAVSRPPKTRYQKPTWLTPTPTPLNPNLGSRGYFTTIQLYKNIFTGKLCVCFCLVLLTPKPSLALSG